MRCRSCSGAGVVRHKTLGVPMFCYDCDGTGERDNPDFDAAVQARIKVKWEKEISRNALLETVRNTRVSA